MNIFTNANVNCINWNPTNMAYNPTNMPNNLTNMKSQNPFITASMTESLIIYPNGNKNQDEISMQTEESICVSALKNKRMIEQQKSKRRAFINNLRKKMYEENPQGNEGDQIAFQIIDEQQVQSQINNSQHSQQQGEHPNSFDDASNIANNEYSISNHDDPTLSPPIDFNQTIFSNGMNNDSFINNNSNNNNASVMNNNQYGGSVKVGETGVNQNKTKCSPQDIIDLIQYVYKGGQKLAYKDSRKLKQELTLLRKNLISINSNMNSSMRYSENMNIMEGNEDMVNSQQQQQQSEMKRKEKEAELFGNDIGLMIQIFQGMLYIVQNQEKFSMDVVYECIWTLSNYSSTEDIRTEILHIYEQNADTFLSFINNCCLHMVDQQQASILLTKVILIIGNLCLESNHFCKYILTYADNQSNNQQTNQQLCQNQLLANIQNTILYLPNPSLIVETIWLLGIFYKNNKFFFYNHTIPKNIAHILNKFKTHPRVVQELLWYLISLSQDGDNVLHSLYFDENVLIRILGILISSSHNGNMIACLTLLSNTLAMLPEDKIEFITGLAIANDGQANNEIVIIRKQIGQEFNPNYKNALLTAINKCISSNIIEIQRECLVFLSNLVVSFPLYIAQIPELINSLLFIFQNGQEELFTDLCYIFSNLFIQLPQSQLLAQQHPQLIPLLQTIITNQNIQSKYSSSLNFVFQHFANFLQSIKY